MNGKRLLSLVLALALTLGMFIPGATPAKAAEAAVEDDSYFNFDNEGLWMTEIYANDVDRNAATDTRATDGYYAVSLFDSTSDLMEFVEVVSTHEQDIKLNDLYEVYYNDTLMTITTCDGSSDVTLTKGQPVVLWNYRTDVTATLPTEEQFRTDMRVPDDALVLKACINGGWSSSATFSIKSKTDGRTLCTFDIVNDTHAVDGLAVALKLPMMFSNVMEVYRAMNLPSPGYINDDQVNGMLQTVTDDNTGKGVYITEVRPNDVNRNSTYGTGDDYMECWEVTNTTDTAIDLNTEYQLAYTVKESYRKPLPVYKYSASASNHVGSSEGCTVPAGGTAVIWLYRETYLTGYKKFPTEANFRSAYSIPSDVPVYIVTNQSGMHNYDRGVELYKLNADGTWKEPVSTFFYHAEDCVDDTSAILKINPDGPEMLVHTSAGTTTMGTYDASQFEYTFDNGEYIELHLFEGEYVPAAIKQGEDLRLRFYYEFTSTMPRLETVMYYRFNGTGDWTAVVDGGIRLPNTYEPVITAEKLFDQDYVEVYVIASNPHRSSVCGIFRIDIESLNAVDGIRTNIGEGEEVRGTIAITANDGTDNANTKIYVDGFKKTTMKMLEDGGYFSFYSEGRDAGFNDYLTNTKNELIKNISHWLYANLPGQVIHIDSSDFTYSSSSSAYNVTLRFWAGTMGHGISDTLEPSANRDDYTVTNLQMKLPNGNTYLPTKIGPSSYNGVDTSGKTNLSTAYDAVHKVGDSTNWCPYMDVTFSIPSADAPAIGVKVDTTTLTDGVHTLKVTNGTASKEVTFIVDNTAPSVNLGISSGATLTGDIVLNPQITEANTLDTVSATLDGGEINLPYAATARELGAGSHTLSVYAKDAAGNETTKSVTFNVADVSMTLSSTGTADITHNTAKLQLTVNSSSAAETTFYPARGVDSSAITATTTDGLVPYITYTVNVGEVSEGQVIMASWDGTASNADDAHVSTMYARNVKTGAWDMVGKANADGSIENATFSAAEYVENGTATLMVQCMDSDIPDTNTATDGVSGNSSWDGTGKPDDYDFAFAWISDTQGYVQRYPHHFIQMNQWIVDNRDEWKISYVMHTGDIVDDWDAMYQWENADAAMKILDDAGMPYGVLGGNHDVAMTLDDRETYYQYFGEWRVEDQPTFGGSYENNYGHYDLISQNGQDFIIVYMSWNIYQDEIDWMNEVLAKYADRKAILCFHAYTHIKTSVDGLLDYFGVLIRDQVVAKNPNVFAVLNGHYSGATYQTAMFDDDGDGTKERSVYQICTDYQSVTQGGMQYIKFLYFDLDSDKVFINAYSPYYDDYNYYDGTGVDDLAALAKKNSGVASNTDIDSLLLKVDFDTTKHTISADSVSVYVGETEGWGTAQNDADGKAELTVTGLEPETDYAWYAKVTNAETGELEYKLGSFTTAAAPVLTAISVAKVPDKTSYFGKKDTLDVTGGILKLQYSDGSTADHAMSEAIVTGFDNTVAGQQILTVNYEGKTCTFVVEITTATVEFHDWDGTLLSSGEYMYGDAVTVPTDPQRADDDTYSYTFSGWTPAVTSCTGEAVYTATYNATALVVPTLTGKNFSLSFEDEILVNFYFVAENVDATEIGMLVFSGEPAAAAYADADEVYAASYNASTGYYMGQTKGIAAKKMGDTCYYAAYAKLADGSYLYSPLYEYSPRKYAMNVLGRASSTDNMKALCVAMLNYGAAAQEYFNYKTDDLMNAALTAEQQGMVQAYDASLFKGAVAADAAKVGSFTQTAGGFSSRSATVSFEGAFAVNYYFAPSAAVVGDLTMYYWTPEAYAAASQLTVDNASGSAAMVSSGDGSYWGQVSGIAAKMIDETYYVAAVYADASGNSYCTGVIAYSLSRYCMNNAKDGNSMQNLAAATAMYGYYAKAYFGSI